VVLLLVGKRSLEEGRIDRQTIAMNEILNGELELEEQQQQQQEQQEKNGTPQYIQDNQMSTLLLESTPRKNASARKEVLLLLLAGFFFVNTVSAELISGKLFMVGPFVTTMGSIMWPVVFVMTDIINEYYGKRLMNLLTVLTAGFLIYVFALLFLTIQIPAAPVSPVSDTSYSIVFGQSSWIIIGSLVAFVTSQLLDVFIFGLVRRHTQGRYLWARSTGSTLVSQLVDTFVVQGIAFLIPGTLSVPVYLKMASSSYVYKLIVAILMTPTIYLIHHLIEKLLGKQEAEKMIHHASQGGTLNLLSDITSFEEPSLPQNEAN